MTDKNLLIEINIKVDMLKDILNKHLHEHFKMRIVSYAFLGSLIVGLAVALLKIN